MTVTAATTYSARPAAESTASTNASLDALSTHVVGPTPGVIPPSTAPASGASPDIAGSATITPTAGRMRFTPAAARTGIIMAAGTVDGQMVIIQNDAAAANSLTFAAAGTSRVADGATTAIAGVTARTLVWDATTSLWYRAGA